MDVDGACIRVMFVCRVVAMSCGLHAPMAVTVGKSFDVIKQFKGYVNCCMTRIPDTGWPPSGTVMSIGTLVSECSFRLRYSVVG